MVTWCPTKNLGPIGSAVLTFIGYKQTDKQTDKPNLYIDLKLWLNFSTKSYRAGYQKLQIWISKVTDLDIKSYRAGYQKLQSWISKVTDLDIKSHRSGYQKVKKTWDNWVFSFFVFPLTLIYLPNSPFLSFLFII